MNDGLRLHEAFESKRHGSFVNNDTRHRHGRLRPAVTVPCADCGLQTQIGSNCWIRGLTANRFFLFRGRDVAIAINSVKILHAVRSAITAIAELLVKCLQNAIFVTHDRTLVGKCCPLL